MGTQLGTKKSSNGEWPHSQTGNGSAFSIGLPQFSNRIQEASGYQDPVFWKILLEYQVHWMYNWTLQKDH